MTQRVHRKQSHFTTLAFQIPLATRSHFQTPLSPQSTFVTPAQRHPQNYSLKRPRNRTHLHCSAQPPSQHELDAKSDPIHDVTENGVPPTTNPNNDTSSNDISPSDNQLSSDASDSQIEPPNANPPDNDLTEESQKAKPALAGFLLWSWTALKRAFAPGGFFWGLAAGLAISAAVLLFPAGSGDASLREKVTLFDFILQDINSSYVDQVDINKMFETGVNSMLRTLDPYTQFENNSQAVEMSVKTNGRYAGVGLGISLGDGAAEKDKPIIVVSAFEGYAFDAGVRPGDIIEAVAGSSVKGFSLEKVTDMLRGEPGTTVHVTIRREGAMQPLDFSLNRRNVRIKDVPASTFVGDVDDSIGYIKLQSFAKDAASEVRSALQQLISDAKSGQGKGLNGLVLDLRGNPGGLLSAAIEVSEVLLPKDSIIVSTKGRGLGAGPIYEASKNPLLPSNLPLAILVNGQTASASEIVAGAVQDLDYGIIVGSRTFGKGLVQNVQELPFRTALKYTVGKYYTPSGRCIQSSNYQQVNGEGPVEATKVEESERKTFLTRTGRVVRDGGGIEPDVEIQKRASFLELALLRQNMYFHFANKYGAELKLESLPRNFAVTDNMYRDFVKYVQSSEFRYESRFDEAFDQLDEMFKDVGYESARGRVKDLKQATESEMKSDFIRHENEIRVQIESAVRYRFQPDSERIIAELQSDDQLAKAIGVLKNEVEYDRLLHPEGGMKGSD